MAAFEVRQIFMPYCLQRLQDGGYLFLNRRYKPLGVTSDEWVDYDTHPSKFHFARTLSARQVEALSCRGSADAERIYLYNDGCIPTDSDVAWKAYSVRLQRLAGYRMK